MANLQVKDGAAATKYLKATGAGSNGDPHVPEHLDTNSAAILAAIELLAGAVAAGKMVIGDGGGSITVDGVFYQTTQPVSGIVTASNVTGNVAAGATDSGNPVKIGGVYTASAPTLADGQRGDLRLDANGKLIIASTNSDPATGTKQDTGNTSLASIATNTTGVATATNQATTNTSLASIDSKIPSSPSTAGNQTTANTKLDTLHTDLVSVDGHVDGLETAVASTNTKLDTVHTDLGSIDGHVDGIETLIGTTNTTLSTIDGHVDGLETSASSIDTKTPALGQALAAGSTPVVLTAIQLTTLTPPAAITGFATSANQTTELASLASIDGKITAVNTGAVAVSSSALPSGAATAANQATELTDLGSVTETAPASDTASSGLNGRLQRIAQRLTSLIALFPTALGGTTAANSFPVTLSTDGPFVVQTGAITETAPATDTASSGLNGRLQRIAQRITSLIALVPTSLSNGFFQVSVKETITLPVSGTFWQTTQPVSVAATLTTKQAASTATASTVSSSATNVTILASNANRLGATVYNDSTQVLYLKLGATASTTSHAVQMAAGGYYEVPFGYTGILDGIWASANGNARVVEVTV